MTFAVSANAVEGVTLTIDDSTDNDDKIDGNDGMSTGAIVGLIIGVALLVIIIVSVYCYMRKSVRKTLVIKSKSLEDSLAKFQQEEKRILVNDKGINNE